MLDVGSFCQYDMATLKNGLVERKTEVHELGGLKKEGKLVEDYFNLASVKKVFSHQLVPSGPINFTVDSSASYLSYPGIV